MKRLASEIKDTDLQGKTVTASGRLTGVFTCAGYVEITLRVGAGDVVEVDRA